jgi:hypothetical protein
MKVNKLKTRRTRKEKEEKNALLLGAGAHKTLSTLDLLTVE